MELLLGGLNHALIQLIFELGNHVVLLFDLRLKDLYPLGHPLILNHHEPHSLRHLATLRHFLEAASLRVAFSLATLHGYN